MTEDLKATASALREKAAAADSMALAALYEAEARGIERAMKSQPYRYIGKDGKPVLVRDLEDDRDALRAHVAELEAERDALVAGAHKPFLAPRELAVLNARKAAVAAAPKGEPGAVTLRELRPFWKKHGGDWHGPRVERWSIPEDNMVQFFTEAAMHLVGMSMCSAPASAGVTVKPLVLGNTTPEADKGKLRKMLENIEANKEEVR